MRLLDTAPAAPVRLRLLRDVLGRPARAPEVRAARRELAAAAGVRRLAAEQRPDGGFGRFHSRDSRARRRVPTTEFGVRRAVALGLSPRDPVLARARAHCEALLAGRSAFPDPPERNDRWETGWRLFVASTLARIAPRARALGPTLRVWRDVLTASFARGAHDLDAEVVAHRRSTGASVRGSYLRLDSRYAVELLASGATDLPSGLLDAYLHWLTTSRSGIGYLGARLDRPPPLDPPGRLEAWLGSWELVARYPRWQQHAGGMARWLRSRREPDGTWELGPRGAGSHVLPLSDGWRRPADRRADWSARVLSLLARWQQR